VCQSNLNRSMEAHWLLQEEGNIRAYSFGAGTKVRLPGETLQTPHVYEFGTPYTQMYKSVARTHLFLRAAHMCSGPPCSAHD